MNLATCIYSCLLLYLHLNLVLSTAAKDENHFDLLIFTQQWPPTVCKEWKDHNPSHTCTLPSKGDTWTIHGIWPTKFGTIGPAFCNKTWHFNPDLIKPIETKLSQYWTNIENGTTKYSLWSHEWSKHGTCAAVLEPLNNELKYFDKGLEWFQKYSLPEILESKHITPSNKQKYPIKAIHDAIHDTVGTNPAIECRKMKGGESWIVEIRICFDKNLEPVDCDGIVGYERDEVITNCDTSEDISYPLDLSHQQAGMEEEEEKEKNLVIFSQQWPVTLCAELKNSDPSQTCVLPRNPYAWTISGIWLTQIDSYFNEQADKFCNNTLLFDIQLVGRVETRLAQYWNKIYEIPEDWLEDFPNVPAKWAYYNNQRELFSIERRRMYDYWLAAWSENGTCLAEREPFSNEYKYFEKGLEWMEKYSIPKILESVSITPSDYELYNVATINRAIVDTVHGVPIIKCTNIGGRSYLAEIRLCFDEDLEVTDCDGADNSVDSYRRHNGRVSIITNCDFTGILYPRVYPNSLYVNLYNLFNWLQGFIL